MWTYNAVSALSPLRILVINSDVKSLRSAYMSSQHWNSMMDVIRTAGYILCFGAYLMISLLPLEQVIIHFSCLILRQDILNSSTV